MILAFVSDTTKHRIGYALFAECLCIAGLAILTTVHHNLHVEYAALFVSLTNAGSVPYTTGC